MIPKLLCLILLTQEIDFQPGPARTCFSAFAASQTDGMWHSLRPGMETLVVVDRHGGHIKALHTQFKLPSPGSGIFCRKTDPLTKEVRADWLSGILPTFNLRSFHHMSIQIKGVAENAMVFIIQVIICNKEVNKTTLAIFLGTDMG